MSKVLLDTELAEIVSKAVEGDDAIEDNDAYGKFVTDLGELIALHLGVEVVTVSEPLQPEGPGAEAAECRWCVHFAPTDSTPSDGGIFAEYDTDVTIEEWFAGADIGVPS